MLLVKVEWILRLAFCTYRKWNKTIYIFFGFLLPMPFRYYAAWCSCSVVVRHLWLYTKWDRAFLQGMGFLSSLLKRIDRLLQFDKSVELPNKCYLFRCHPVLKVGNNWPENLCAALCLVIMGSWLSAAFVPLHESQGGCHLLYVL